MKDEALTRPRWGIIAAVAVGIAALAAASMMRARPPHEAPPQFISEQESELLDEYEKIGLITVRLCASNAASVDPELWSAVPQNKQRTLVRVLGGWCAAQGRPYRMTLVDTKGRRVLARWNGRESEIVNAR